MDDISEGGMSYPGRVAVFAGTTEGRRLVEHLSACGVGTIAFVATSYGASLISGLPHVSVREGRLDAGPEHRPVFDGDINCRCKHGHTILSFVLSDGVRRGSFLRRLAPGRFDHPLLAGLLGDAVERLLNLVEQLGVALLDRD